MSDQNEPVTGTNNSESPPSHQRILVIMAAVGLVGAAAGAAYVSAAFGLGVILGTGLAFANYFWLKHSLKRIAAAESGERPRMLAGKYFLRYLILAAVVAVIYMTGGIPIVAVVLGMAGFGFAVVIEGFIRSFSSVFIEKEI